MSSRDLCEIGKTSFVSERDGATSEEIEGCQFSDLMLNYCFPDCSMNGEAWLRATVV